ncbi:polysaccharide lyase family 7 protein [uncultured Winogradskyella sp.]|uniref:polysaccharide lyase family 7 protein n=1 Tax=uncultured Winogradskyella sp. TaxID=395353 RepID=UPI0026264D14|nr:polysaccharide lyase family 7 protein [uncultured Winogradskyella sp.]|tara:strand:+ start:6955 stop:7833 length:879 start_codon:yes stop_codon:yes gene_type:complete
MNFNKVKTIRLSQILLCGLFIFLFVGCSSDDTTSDSEDEQDISDDDPIIDDEPSDLEERYVFGENLVIEHSWDTDGCDSPPCSTNQDNLNAVFENTLPNDPYFYMDDDEIELNLVCQLEKGRRVEFKQTTEGPLTSYSKMEFEGVYYSIPDGGMTIAQVHNRGGNSNKPFFRLELHSDKLETVIRKDPEVSSSQTSFIKMDFPFVNNGNYTLFPLKVTLEKNNGFVSVKVMQDDIVIVDEDFQADTTTDWANDTGIANGFYLKAGLYNAATTHTENLTLGYTTFMFETDDTN